MGHIPREISRHVYYFLTAEGGTVSGHVVSTEHRYSPIPAGGLEIPLLLKFACADQEILLKMKAFVNAQYDYNFTGTRVVDSEDEEDEDVIEIILHENEQEPEQDGIENGQEQEQDRVENEQEQDGVIEFQRDVIVAQDDIVIINE